MNPYLYFSLWGFFLVAVLLGLRYLYLTVEALQAIAIELRQLRRMS